MDKEEFNSEELIIEIHNKTYNEVINNGSKPELLILDSINYKKLVKICNDYYSSLKFSNGNEDSLKDVTKFNSHGFDLKVIGDKFIKGPYIEVFGKKIKFGK